MEMMEKIEMIREKAGVSYTEAKAALEMNNGDVLDALCWLEQHGKTQMMGASASTADREPEPEPEEPKRNSAARDNFRSGCRNMRDFVRSLVQKGNRNNLVARNSRKETIIGIPVTLVVILLLACFWVIVPLLIVGLFFGCSYSFEGPELGREDLNNAMDHASEWADQVKKEFQEKK